MARVVPSARSPTSMPSQGITKKGEGTGLTELWDRTLEEVKGPVIRPSSSPTSWTSTPPTVTAVTSSYADALEYFDPVCRSCSTCCKDGDVVVLTADHGCDPTWAVPTTPANTFRYCSTAPVKAGSVGRRETFADIGQSIAAYHGLPKLQYGTSFPDGDPPGQVRLPGVPQAPVSPPRRQRTNRLLK